MSFRIINHVKVRATIVLTSVPETSKHVPDYRSHHRFKTIGASAVGARFWLVFRPTLGVPILQTFPVQKFAARFAQTHHRLLNDLGTVARVVAVIG